MDAVTKWGSLLVPLLTAAVGFVTGSLRGSPFRSVNHALDTRKKFVDAGADPRVWDRMLALELRHLHSPFQRAMLRIASTLMTIVVLSSLVLVALTTFVPLSAVTATTARLGGLAMMLVVVCALMSWVSMRFFNSDNPQAYSAWSELPPDSPEFDFTAPTPVELPATTPEPRRGWLPWRRRHET